MELYSLHFLVFHENVAKYAHTNLGLIYIKTLTTSFRIKDKFLLIAQLHILIRREEH